MNRRLVLLLILILTASSLVVVKPIHSSTTKPSVPEFTVKFVNASYSVTTTNPYTGVNETQQIGNNSVEVTIKNQRFDHSYNGLSYHIYFDIRTKPHFSDNWTEVYPLENSTSSYNGDGTFSYAEYISPDSPTQSNSSYTVISFPVVPTELYQASGYDIQRYYSGEEGQEGMYSGFLKAVPYGGQVDFQVKALVGHASQWWVIEHPFYPTIGGHFSPAVAFDSTSGWSNTQTITIGTNTPTATPSPSPSSSPQETEPQPEAEPFPTTLVIASIGSVAIVGLGVLVYLKKRQKGSLDEGKMLGSADSSTA
jgi:hypothetical protein